MTQQELVDLSEVSLFKDLDILDLDAFFKKYPLRIQQFENDQLVAEQGDLYEELIILIQGRVTASMTAPNGKVVRLETLSGPCAAATAVLFSSQKSLPVTLHANNLCRIVRIPENLIVKLMQTYPSFLRSYLRENGDKLIFLSEKIRLFQFKSLKQKIISHLLMLSDRQGKDDVDMVYSREELAQLMGVARPSLSREFSNLANIGLIEARGKKVLILDRQKLLRAMRDE
jgi:CRP-like cAMP-binding protein